MSTTNVPHSSAQPPSKGARPLHPRGNGGQAGHLPTAASSALDGGAGALLRNFNGVSSRDSANTNFGLEFEPPDQGLCVGNGFVLEAVNSAYTIYHIDATDLGNPGCPCLGDQPLLGIDAFNVYLSTNEFSILGPQFNGAQFYAISKSELVSLAHKVPFVHFGHLRIGGAIAASVQPAITNGPASAEYFMDSLDPNGTFDNRLGVWALTDRGAVSRGGIPNLSKVVINSEPYGLPPGAIQKGAKSLLDSGDDRMQQVQFINGQLWGALDTALTIPNDNAERAGAAWFEVHPHLNGEVIGGADIVNQGYVALRGNYLLYPAIQASAQGTAVIVMTLSGPTFFPSAVYTVLQAGHTSFGTIHIAAPGTGHYDPKATRWGDYSWATLDPSGNSFWLATEYFPPRSSQTVDRLSNWGTRVLEVSA